MRFVLSIQLACVLALCCGLVAACASSEPSERMVAEPDPGWVLYTELEERLLRARTVELHATMTADGAVNATLNADLWLEGERRARLEVRGTFEGERVERVWLADGERARLDDGVPSPAPADVRAAFVRGLMAMGLMHNAALLAGGRAPDHVDGGVRDFVRAERPRMAPEGLAIDLDVVVRNAHVADATLALDPEGLPRDRTQLVRFDDGEMRVREIYSGVRLDRPLDAARFSLTPGAQLPAAHSVEPEPAGPPADAGVASEGAPDAGAVTPATADPAAP